MPYKHSLDRWPDHQNMSRNNSAVSKLQHQYWITKQTVFRKLGKKEDECIVASDAELDAKLELFRSIQDSCLDLQKIIDRYQERLCTLAQEENSMGRFLKDAAKRDKTKAGEMMSTVGKALSASGQERISLRSPLIRLYQEVETFRVRAIEDTKQNVQTMEKCREEYRASLNWMKDVSQQLDPDTYKQMNAFRKVQEHVKKSKTQFDRQKLDCLQKVDLLAAARCNMFSHALILYQNTLLQFTNKSTDTFTSIVNSYKDHQHQHTTLVKELAESSTPPLSQAVEADKEDDQEDKLVELEDLLGELDSPSSENSKDKKKEKEETAGNCNDLLLADLLSDNLPDEDKFLPSQILAQLSVGKPITAKKSLSSETTGKTVSTNPSNKGVKKPWLDLFAELDPLSANPDAVGKPATDQDRNC